MRRVFQIHKISEMYKLLNLFGRLMLLALFLFGYSAPASEDEKNHDCVYTEVDPSGGTVK